ncbi:MAG: heavy-metal-associated domain-containing protein [Gemmatimonadaceae bacterium]|nr:heavy-metal-associated domain-containing protein [Gemmatimonadaceae bacterium]
MAKETLEIGGMTCGHCLRTVKNALESIDGVSLEEVRIGKATVDYDETKVRKDAIAEAIRDAGYTVLATL